MKEKYVIANNDNTRFIGRDSASGGYPYVTGMLEFCLIGSYEYINEYHKGLERFINDASDFSIKRIVLEEISIPLQR